MNRNTYISFSVMLIVILTASGSPNTYADRDVHQELNSLYENKLQVIKDKRPALYRDIRSKLETLLDRLIRLERALIGARKYTQNFFSTLEKIITDAKTKLHILDHEDVQKVPTNIIKGVEDFNTKLIGFGNMEVEKRELQKEISNLYKSFNHEYDSVVKTLTEEDPR